MDGVDRLVLGLAGRRVPAACARAAKTTPDAPPLDMPAPPPREVEPNEIETPPPVPLVDRAGAKHAAAAPTPAARAGAEVEPPKPAEPPKPSRRRSSRPSRLKSRRSRPRRCRRRRRRRRAKSERAIRASMSRATSALNRIDYRVLNADARTQYDTAKRFDPAGRRGAAREESGVRQEPSPTRRPCSRLSWADGRSRLLSRSRSRSLIRHRQQSATSRRDLQLDPSEIRRDSTNCAWHFACSVRGNFVLLATCGKTHNPSQHLPVHREALNGLPPASVRPADLAIVELLGSTLCTDVNILRVT